MLCQGICAEGKNWNQVRPRLPSPQRAALYPQVGWLEPGVGIRKDEFVALKDVHKAGVAFNYSRNKFYDLCKNFMQRIGKEFFLITAPFSGEMRVGPLVLETAERKRKAA